MIHSHVSRLLQLCSAWMIRHPASTMLPVWPSAMAQNTAGKMDWLGLLVPTPRHRHFKSRSHHSAGYKTRTALETPHKGIVGCESQYRNRVFISNPACPRDHEALHRHTQGMKDCSVSQSTPELGRIPIHTLSHPRCYLGHVRGFATYSVGAIGLITNDVAAVGFQD